MILREFNMKKLNILQRLALLFVALIAPLVGLLLTVEPADFGKLVLTAVFYVPVTLLIIALYGKDHREELIQLLPEEDREELRSHGR